MIITVLSVCVVPNIKDLIFFFWFCFVFCCCVCACVCVRKNDSFYWRGTGKFFLVPNMLLQTWFLLLFCEAVVYMKL